MSANAQMAALLDQLMGAHRDGEPNKAPVKFTDRDVCKNFLLDMCPNELFVNTRADIGPCTLVHSVALKQDYEKASKTKDYGFEEEVMINLRTFIKDCDRKITQAKRRLEENPVAPEIQEKADKIHDIGEQIGEKLAKAEKLGEEGNVDESMRLMQEIEDLKNAKKEAEEDYKRSVPPSQLQQQRLRVCEVCAAYLSLHDNDRRLADHFGGKLHLGFVHVRSRLKELEAEVEEKQKEREKKREREREKRRERDREVDRDRDHDRDRDRDRDRRRERDRDRDKDKDREKDEDRDRDRDRDRYRHRDRDHGGDSRDRDRHRRRRSRSRSRERRRSRRDSDEGRKRRDRSIDREHGKEKEGEREPDNEKEKEVSNEEPEAMKPDTTEPDTTTYDL
jgi:hypothetical protein